MTRHILTAGFASLVAAQGLDGYEEVTMVDPDAFEIEEGANVNTWESTSQVGLSCMVSAESTFWDINPLMRTNDSYYSTGDFRFNFCTHVSLEDSDALDYDMQFLESLAFREETNLIRPLTESTIYPDLVEALFNEDENSDQIIGVRISYKANDVCKVEGNHLKYYGFVTEIYCNEDYSENGQPDVIEVLNKDGCEPRVRLQHSSGCPTYTVAGLTKFFQNQFWIPGIFCILLGMWVMHEGRFWFRMLTGIVSLLLFFNLYFLTMVYYHIPEHMMARLSLSLLGSAVITFTIYWFSDPKKGYFIDIIFIAILCGFFGGLMVCLTFSQFMGGNYYMMAFTCGATGAGVLCVAIKRRHNTDSPLNQDGLVGFKLISTTTIGSYLTMRGFSTLIGGYPSETQTIKNWMQDSQGNSTGIEPLPWTFWLYLFLFAGGIFISQKMQRSLPANGEGAWILWCEKKVCKRCCGFIANLREQYDEKPGSGYVKKQVCNYKSHTHIKETKDWAKVREKDVGKLLINIESLFDNTKKEIEKTNQLVQSQEGSILQKLTIE